MSETKIVEMVRETLKARAEKIKEQEVFDIPFLFGISSERANELIESLRSYIEESESFSEAYMKVIDEAESIDELLYINFQFSQSITRAQLLSEISEIGFIPFILGIGVKKDD